MCVCVYKGVCVGCERFTLRCLSLSIVLESCNGEPCVPAPFTLGNDAVQPLRLEIAGLLAREL